jgi:hypothetical protein
MSFSQNTYISEIGCCVSGNHLGNPEDSHRIFTVIYASKRRLHTSLVLNVLEAVDMSIAPPTVRRDSLSFRPVGEVIMQFHYSDLILKFSVAWICS